MSDNLFTYPVPYTWRSARREDGPAIRQVMVEAVEIDSVEAAPSQEEIDRIFDQLGTDVETDTLVGLTADHTIAAYIVLFMPPTQEEHVVQVNALVDVNHRRRGLGTFLLRWAEARTRQKVSQFNDGKPGRIQMGCREHMKDHIALFEKCGFRPVRYFYKMERDLSQPIPEKSLADGLTLNQWQPELDAATMEAFNDSFRDHWNFFPVNPELWGRWFTGTPDFRGDLSYLALDGEQVTGFTICSLNLERNEQTGKQEAWLNDIGVIRDWRKRGVASAVIVASLRAFKKAGMAYAALGVDTQNPTGALRLYENLGFTAVRRDISFSKALERLNNDDLAE